MLKTQINDSGFSLIELIVVLTLVGILASVAGMGIAWSMRGYTTSRETVAITQKAQLALLRIHKELSALSDIKLDTSGNGSTGTCMIYKAEIVSPNYRIIRYNSASDELEYLSSAACATCACPAVSASTLADSLNSAAISYYPTSGTTAISPGLATYTAADIGYIEVALEFKRTGSSTTHPFTIIVSPRNNGNLNAPGFAS